MGTTDDDERYYKKCSYVYYSSDEDQFRTPEKTKVINLDIIFKNVENNEWQELCIKLKLMNW